MSTTLLSLSTSVLLILSFVLSYQSPVLAETTSTRVDSNIIKNDNFALSFQRVAQQVVALPALITNFSSKGIYKVQLGWNSPVSIQSLEKGGFSMYVRFMNATAPPGTLKTIPNRLNGGGLGTTIGASGTQYRVPHSIQRLATIKSFDMTIYGKHGKVLWNKVDQVPSAGLKFEYVVLPKTYNGNITISIHNIKSLLPGVPTDSVDFATRWE
jgi:hypothetical protein